MKRLTFTTHRNYLVVPAAILVAMVLVQQIFAVPENTILVPTDNAVLATYNGSLTTYKPSGKSGIQGIRALIDQSGVNFDGTLRLGSTHRMALAGDPFGQSWNRNQMLSGVRLDTGTFIINDVDLGFPAQVPWVIGRSYNARQHDGTSYFASTGYQGKNWFQSSQPELVFFDSATDSEDLIYLIYGADRFIALNRVDVQGTPSTTTFKAINGAAGAILLHTFDGIDLATYYDQNGNRFDFFWFGDADTDDDIEGSIWRIMDPTIEVDPYDTQDRLVSTDGNVAYVGDIGNPNTALSSGYDATTGAITTAYDSAGRRFTYTSNPGGLLAQVKAEVNSGGWTEIGKVDYSYYVAADSHGEWNDLELVTITMPLTDSGVSQVRKKHYWYYEGTYNATTNPGYHHQIQYIIDFEGYRNYDWAQDSNLDDDPLSATEANLKPYASAYFEYDTERRLVEAWFNGACGCSGAASGTHIFEYESNGSYSDGAGYDEDEWKSRTIVKKPNVTFKTSSGAIKSYITQYFDEMGQPLDRVLTDDDPDNTAPAPSFWATKIDRDSNGQVVAIHSPANVTAYTHSTASFTTSTSAGMVRTFTRASSGNLIRFVDDGKHKTGTSGSAYLDSNPKYLTTSRTLTVGDAGVTRPFILSRRVYTQEITSGTTGSHLTSFSYDWHSATATDVLFLAPKKITQTNPAVSTGNNGSGSSTTVKRYLRKDGTTAFVESATGIFTYSQFTDGQLTKRIDDVKTNGTFDTGDDPNTDWGITETTDGWNRTTTLTYDDQGRRDLVTPADGPVRKTYYSKIADGRSATLAYADYEDLATDKYHGPVSYTVANHAGKAEVTATVELSGNESTLALTNHIDETKSDPITAMETTSNKLGDLARMTVSVYDETGTTLQESRPFFLIPASGSGTEGTNYDATFFGYDDQGRRYRTKAPTGTINRSDFDSLGRAVRQWIGDNDNAFNGGESSGTDNMVKTSENVYDSGNDKGNSYLTKRTAFVQDSDTDKRDTTFEHDVRGRVLLTTTPTAPYPFNKYDNMGRLIASGQFSSTASIVVGADDPTTETTNRLALSQTFYDERGQVWKSQRHKIDDADGSDDDNLQTLTWKDAAGRTIKIDGSQLTKTAYDRLGRQTHQFTLANDNDTAYADADDVTGDIVLLESQTVYESTNSSDVLMRVTISRHAGDKGVGETTGALDTNADNDDLLVTATNLAGRAQITAMWYDRFGRVTDTVRYGTNGGSNFDRDGLSVPARSDTALLTEQTYNDDGTLQSTTDPRSLERRLEYDDLGRQTAIVANYVNGTPSGDNGDDDVHTRYVYTDGLRTKMWVDFDGDNVVDTGDQDTIYTYGTTKGVSAGDSKIQTGHLLQKVQYPDSAGGTDVVTFAYNAQSQQIWTKDQEGNIIETDFDTSGRQTHRRITTLDADFDGAVRRISTTYNNRGQRELVTQYDNATVGSGSVVDEVKFTYEDWGNISKFEQDHDSAVGGTLLYDVDYAYEKATTGRNTIRRTTMDLPDGNVITFTYLQGGSLHDKEASRVTQVKDGTVVLARYWYNGVGQVVGIDYGEPDVFMHRSSGGTFNRLDNFDRVKDDIWTKDLATDVNFFDLDISYDRNSNITLIEDNIHVGFDADYTIDKLNRLRKAEEGTWNGSTITSRTRQQLWEDSSGGLALDQVGNWDQVRLDLNGDNDFVDAREYDDDRTHNDANELTGRDTDDNGTDNYTLVYDAVGNLTDDAENYQYVYDPFGRLRKVKTTSPAQEALVAEYTYSGLGHRIGWHYDVDSDNDVDVNDPWVRFVYDERWRIVGTFRASDSSPKEQFIYHNAGADGRGGSSYIDTVICRDRDANVNWAAAADGTLEERIYYCHNWRGDVSVLIEDDGDMIEWVKYSSYGIPFGLPKGDADSDGDVDVGDTADTDQIQTWIDAPAYDVRGDLNLDGNVDATDKSLASSVTLGWGNLSEDPDSGAGNRKGYAGYEFDSGLSGTAGIYHVRNRVFIASLGRWTRRDTENSSDSDLYVGFRICIPNALPSCTSCICPPACVGWLLTSSNCACPNGTCDYSCTCVGIQICTQTFFNCSPKQFWVPCFCTTICSCACGNLPCDTFSYPPSCLCPICGIFPP